MGKRKASGAGAALRGGPAAKRLKDSRRADATTAEKLYLLQDVILVLGDGDFTFSKGLIAHRGGGRNLVATSYDSESKVKTKYSNAADCIQAVRTSGAIVLHGVDATKLHLLSRRARDVQAVVPPFFKYIIFNFPHTGQQRVHINRALLLEFFESARTKLVKTGEVHITLKNRPPYSNWNVEDQAKTAGFVLKERRRFNIRNFPGYNHRTTDPQAKAFEAELCITYVFVVNRSKYPFEAIAAAVDELASDVDEDIQHESRLSASDPDDTHVDKKDESVDETEKPGKNSRRKRSKRRSTASSSPVDRNQQDVGTEKQTIRRSSAVGLWRPLHRRGRI